MSSVLAFENLSIDFETPTGPVHAVRNVNFEVPDNMVVGIVGESGCGKTTVISAAMSLLSNNAVVASGRVSFEQQDILKLSEAALRKIRGEKISMVFQDPMTSLNPVISIGKQMIDIQYRQTEFSLKQKRSNAVDMLNRVGIPDPEMRLNQFPHELSGGMRQRISIAMAILMKPLVLIADEPTTALDVTMEAQIIHLLRELQREFSSSILFASHNLGLIAELCDEVVVMYAGEVAEKGTCHDIFHRPTHPYTKALLACDPSRISERTRKLPTIQGDVPNLQIVPEGCVFADRCPVVHDPCYSQKPTEFSINTIHKASCHLLHSDN
tara:strand:+ start:3296 stop:4270 length:975 start_codon:yes stop_codon:yes gene_type:complete